MELKNCYNILGVKDDASLESIKNAYVKLLKRYHPDLYKGDKVFAENKTASIIHAYDYIQKNYLEKSSNNKSTTFSEPKTEKEFKFAKEKPIRKKKISLFSSLKNWINKKIERIKLENEFRKEQKAKKAAKKADIKYSSSVNSTAASSNSQASVHGADTKKKSENKIKDKSSMWVWIFGVGFVICLLAIIIF